MSGKWGALVFTLVGLVFVVVTAFIVSAYHRGLSTVDVAAVIAITGAAAVGVERVIEMIWVLVSQFASDWWPMKLAAKGLKDLGSEVNTQITPFFEAAKTRVNKSSAEWTQIDNAQNEVVTMLKNATSSRRSPPGRSG